MGLLLLAVVLLAKQKNLLGLLDHLHAALVGWNEETTVVQTVSGEREMVSVEKKRGEGKDLGWIWERQQARERE